jgi:hypothetical protein
MVKIVFSECYYGEIGRFIMSKKEIRKLIIAIVLVIIAVFIGVLINRYYTNLNAFKLAYEPDTTTKYKALEKWINTRQNIWENLFYLLYTVSAIVLILMVIIELKHDIFPKKEIVFYCYFLFFSTVARNAIFGTVVMREIITIALFLVALLFSCFLDKEFAKNEENCLEVSEEELFESRRNLIDAIVSDLERADDDLKGILIKGKWGIGKTTVVELVKDKLKHGTGFNNKYKFINLNVGYSCEPGKLINEIETQLIDALSEDNIYFDHRIVKDYFGKICNLLCEPTKGVTKTIYDFVNIDESKTNSENRLNSFLKDYSNTKFIICIDDLERCPAKDIKQIFAVLVNNLRLSNCITMLIVDYYILTQETGITDEYLKKFFSVQHSINEISFEELADKYINKKGVIDEELNDSNVNLSEHYRLILKSYWNKIDAYFQRYINEDPEFKYAEKTESLISIRGNLHNPREFKYMWGDIQNYVIQIFKIYESDRDSYIRLIADHDIENVIVVAVIMHRFFPTIWEEYLAAGSWDSFQIRQAISKKYNKQFDIEYDCFDNTILKDSFLDAALLDSVVFGFKYKSNYDYVTCVNHIENKSIPKDSLKDYINIFYNNKKLMILLGEYILENQDQVKEDDKFIYCIRYTESISNGISLEYQKLDCQIYQMIWKYINGVNKDIKFKYDEIKSEKIEETFNLCQNNISMSVSLLLRNELKNLDYLADWGYTAITSEVFSTDDFQVGNTIFSSEQEKANFESFMSSILKYEEQLGLRDLEYFIILLVKYFEYCLKGPNRDLLINNSDSKNKYNNSISHIGRMYNIVTDWLGYERKIDVVNDILV